MEMEENTQSSPSKIIPYVHLLVGLALIYFVSSQAHGIFQFFSKSADPHIVEAFFTISLICLLSFGIFYISHGTPIPSFVIAIFFGMAAKQLLEPITHETILLGGIVGFGATLILFGGGLETPWKNFRKLLGRILSLSFIGLFLTALLFSLTVIFLGNAFGVYVPITVAILLGAILASTDPAAIIPILKELRFNNRDTKDIIVSESAVTDVTGTLLTVIFLSLIMNGAAFVGVIPGYQSLFNTETTLVLLKQLFYGVAFGVVGYTLLETLNRFKRGHEKEFEVDAAFFFFVPIIIFTIALAFGGSGYLAAFITGLLFVITENLHLTEKFFNQTIDGFLKPTIFLLLGALVEIDSLIAFAGVGLIAALIFMFVIRPIAVFLTLGPFSFIGENRLGWRDLLFISFVRETGAIPAVLLVTVISLGIPNLDGLVPIGMWVILATLIIQPPLTPYIAKLLKIATPIRDDKSLQISPENEPCVILGSRGNSYKNRLPHVADWATDHGIKRVMLLHCLENDYTSERAEEINIDAESEFAKINKEREMRGKLPIKFIFTGRTGFLQKNIDELSRNQAKVTAIFVGKKVLDYRLEDIKELAVPLYFLP